MLIREGSMSRLIACISEMNVQVKNITLVSVPKVKGMCVDECVFMIATNTAIYE